jgi:RHS repeat-associated protein
MNPRRCQPKDNTSINNFLPKRFTISGSMQGVGGVGGLLEVSCYGSATTNCFPAFDGNGNVAALINAADGTVAANDEYAAFGEPVRLTGVMARNNPLRFSTKYADDESDLLYYGYRFYKPSTGTWPNRDPLNAVVGDEARFELMQNYGFDDDFSRSVAAIPADLNDYIFAHNRPVMDYDLLGLCDPLPDSGPGDFHSNLWGHNLFGGPASSLTFKVCCPAAEQYLASYGISALTSPPPTTGHGHNFPGDFTTVTPPSGSGPCYTIVINVTSTASLGYWNNPWVNFVNEIRVTGKCCACSSGNPTRSDPPTLPPSPPPPRHGSGN